jgi:hypothetical protein
MLPLALCDRSGRFVVEHLGVSHVIRIVEQAEQAHLVVLDDLVPFF